VDFNFSEQEMIFAETVRRFARERLAPDYAKWDRGTPFPREKLRQLAEVGISGLRVPEQYGGSASSYVMAGIASEEIARGDYNVTLFVQLCSISADILTAHAKDEIKKTWLAPLANGEALIAFGLTEPGVGSDAAALTTSAKREGDCYVINGEKASITYAGMADACIVFARTGGSGARGVGALLVPLDLPGITRRVYQSAGERLTQRGSLVFDNVRVSADHLLGTEGGGFYQAMGAFDYNRALIALASVGAAQQSLEETVEYAKQRRTFGKPIAEREAVSFQISEHLTMIAAARLLAYQCLSLCDQGKPHTKEAAMAKWLGPKAGAEAIHACIILHGWIGYSQELPFEQRLRDAIGLEIGDGTPEIMKGIIARETFGREFNTYR
jgi:cyclohexanecarboxyl-CoA dehydrogenase